MDLGALNGLFAIPGHLHFEAGQGGLTKAVVDNPLATCELYFHGAHVTAYHPKGFEETLWLSDAAIFTEDKAIRGGIPLCWPWFGPHPSDAALPQHGFARNSFWTLFGTSVNGRGETVLRLGLQDSDATRSLFSREFMLEYVVTVGSTLTLELTTTNRGSEPFEITEALHSYFRVTSIEETVIEGFADKTYRDKTDGGSQKCQIGAVVVTEETDRVYDDADPSCCLRCADRMIEIAKFGSAHTVVWNPWQEKAAAMGDFDDDGYRHMVCIEAANTGEGGIILNPDASHTLTQRILPFL